MTMLRYLLIALLYSYVFMQVQCLIIHTQRTKENEEICLKNHFRTFSNNHFRLCYTNHNRDQSIRVWFQMEKSLHRIFHFYRFILRSIDEYSLSTTNIYMLTNFTELIDLNNTLKIFQLHLGYYEICIDFQSNLTSYIYSPRYACLPIRIGEYLHGSFKQSSTQLLIALATGIILFLILCHVVQSWKNRDGISHETDELPQERSRSLSILSTSSLKKQRDRLVRKIFRQHLDQINRSQMQQWARNRAFRHRISTSEQEIQQINSMRSWKREMSDSSNDIYTIPMNKKTSRKISFEEFEIL